jgi:hypothetical protein
MTSPLTQSLDDLIEEIATWPAGMPVRPMERLLARGVSAVPALVEALGRSRDDAERDRLWLVVLLGEFGDAGAVDALIAEVCATDDDALTIAAVEGLARIGPPAVPALLELARAPDPLRRLGAYAGLGWIADERAHGALLEALARDPELGDAVAIALGEQGRSEALPAIYEAYRGCAPWQRIEFEDVLRRLHAGRRPPTPWTRDWRLRFRRAPALESLRPSWLWVALVLRRQAEWKAERVVAPLKTLEEIAQEPPEPNEPSETCEECGAPIEQPTGVAVCPETALATTMYQLRFLGEAREDGTEDLFELLDDLDAREWEHVEGGEPVTPVARERWRDEHDELHLCRQTCEWLIEQGAETVAPARALLLAEASRLADRYGDPEGYLRPAPRPASRGPRVGRNDPCPCGSGRKYKRCCLGRVPAPPTEAAP